MIDSLLNNLSGYMADSSFAAYLAAYLGGLLVSFTPCVYPVMPLVIAYIGARGSRSRLYGFLLSLTYVLGLSLTYAVLGGISALTGRLFGTIQSSFWVAFLVANVCILMGLAMLDVFTIQIRIPGFATSPQTGDMHKSVIGSFLVGITSGLLIGPCSAPVFSVLLAYVATRQNLFFGMSLLFVFALGMGTLLVAIGSFAGLMASLPKSGMWMVRIKHGCGWILIATGEYFLIQAGKSLV
ncbi:cytochrome c biogenesis protein CcdA [Syntrophus aciditrophicus]|uniref:Thiol:disulfide interchange protein n=1 Tax=Syntrophus aciditrophicus (strain SB) TaxID=56780 RepID=Q2LWX5_SYNAS|nr:cytochrome c biogenesis protein CcdA [Syntrophus aciditrophicus]ABC78581.1 thiol:disulfide interchange protein [Syntrophus aciditrophicus SB]OPY16528.1 MAG: Thiol:disulfide interchange protein DsbD precursor [Syntrophus sp. PtaB.Bin075]